MNNTVWPLDWPIIAEIYKGVFHEDVTLSTSFVCKQLK